MVKWFRILCSHSHHPTSRSILDPPVCWEYGSRLELKPQIQEKTPTSVSWWVNHMKPMFSPSDFSSTIFYIFMSPQRNPWLQNLSPAMPSFPMAPTVMNSISSRAAFTAFSVGPETVTLRERVRERYRVNRTVWNHHEPPSGPVLERWRKAAMVPYIQWWITMFRPMSHESTMVVVSW